MGRAPAWARGLAAVFTAAVLLVAAPARLLAGAGRTSGNFLKIMASPRASGMGETGTALADDAMSALYMNPAGMARLVHPEASFSYNKLYEDISLQHFSYAHPTKFRGAFGVSATILQVQDFAGYDNSGRSVGSVQAMDFAVKPAYARRVWGPGDDLRYGLFGGVAVQFAQQKLAEQKSGVVLADAGALYVRKLGPGDFGAGFSVQNAGQGFKFDSQADKAPTFYRFGLSYNLPVLGDPLAFAYDAKMSVYDEFTHSAGFEFFLKRLVAWRAGFISNQSLGTGWRVGVGLKVKVIQFDYGLSQSGKMGYTHIMGVSAKFGAPIDRTPLHSPAELKSRRLILRARDDINERRYFEAAGQLNEALELDPNSKEALKLLRQVRDALEGAR